MDRAVVVGFDSDEAPVGDGQRGMVGELHELVVKLARRSRGWGRVWSGGSAVEQGSSEKRGGVQRCTPAMGLGLAFYRPKEGRMSTRECFWRR